ncbi:fibronectin type III domain-containing protein, partial [Singulisphaera acidiphila]
DRSSAETGYIIEQSLDGVTGWTQTGTTGANATSFSASGPFLGATTYYFRVRAYNFSPVNSSVNSSVFPLTTPAFPSQPTSVRATATVEGTITLVWDDTTNETGYRIERSVNGSTGWTQVGTASANATSYNDAGLPENTRYYYRVIAANAAGDSAPSSAVNALTLLATPGSFTATFVSGTQIDLTWTDRSSVESSYIIEQSLDGVTGWSSVGTASANATNFSLPGPFNGSTTYHFRVRAYNNNPAVYSASPTPAFVTTPAFPSRPTSLIVTIPADGTITLTWAAANATGYRIERSGDGISGWTQVGTVAANVTSYNEAGLPESTRYSYRVIATNAMGASASSPVINAVIPPAAPGSVTATVVSGGQVNLTWTDRSVAESSYVIEQSLNGTTWTSIGSTAANATSFSASGPFVGSTTYYFRVRAYSNTTGYSVSPTPVLVTTPGFPSRLNLPTATASAEGTITLTWADAANETGYRIERSLNGSTGWTQIGTTGAGVTIYNDTGLPENTRYYYRVTATNAAGDSAPSTAANAITLLATPGSVVATVVSGGQIDLTWTDRSSAESGYQIEQSLDGVTGWSLVGTAAANATSFSLPGPFAGSTVYYFRVRANYLSAYSSPTPVTTSAFPTRPTGVTTATTEGTITLTWAVTSNGDSYRIERSLNDTTGWTSIGTTPAGTTSYTDSSLPESTRYSYRVIATNAAGDSAPSASVNAITRPKAPNNLALTVVSGSRIDLTWTARSSSEVFYYVEQSLDGATGWTQIGTTAIAATNFLASGPFDGSTTYYFRVRAYSYFANYSAYSASMSATTPAFPSRPAGATATASDGKITLTWSDVANVTGYRIERSGDGTTGWTQVGIVPANSTSYINSGLPENTRYYYRIFATNAIAASAPSVTINAIVPLATPDGLTAVFVSGGRIDLAWTDRSSVESGYQIEQSLNGTTGWTSIGTAAANATSFSAPGPFLSATTYFFRVRASNSSGTSAYTAPASATTSAIPSRPLSVTATVTADGTISLAWAAATDEVSYRIERSTNSTTGWTTVGVTAAAATSYPNTGLSENTSYYYRVVATNAAGESAPSAVVNALTRPNTPDGLTAVGVSSRRIDLTWIDRSSAESGYVLEQSLNGTTGWTSIGSTVANITSFLAPGPFNGSTTYFFRVRASNSTMYSTSASVTTPAFPNAPTDVTATAAEGTITLAWADVANVTGYRIERSTSPTSGWALLGTTGSGITSYADTERSENLRFYYRVVAINAVGESAPSTSVNAVTLLVAPGSVAAAFVSGGQINLTWTDRSSAELSYLIEQSPDGVTGWVQVGTAAANATSFAAPGPFLGATAYSFRVRAYSNSLGANYSAYSTASSLTTPAFPSRPTGLTATASALAEGSIDLVWIDASGETSYRIERSMNGTSGWTQVGTAVADATGWTDSGLPENTRYYYRVIATNAAGDSAPSVPANGLTKLATPLNLTVTFVAGNRIDLTWTDRSSVESGYYIEQSLDGATGWIQVGAVAANSTSFSAVGPFLGTSAYHFRVRAYATSTANYSAYSMASSLTTPAFPSRPTGVTATASAEGTINLTWIDASDGTGYRIERSLNSTAGWTQVGTAAADATGWTDSNLIENTRYYYRVIAVNADGDSAPSITANGLTKLAAPVSLTIAFVFGNRIDLTWIDRSSDESGYYIEQSLDGETEWTQVGTAAANATSYSASGPFDALTAYHFRVRAYSSASYPNYASNESAYSNSVTLTTPAFPDVPTGLVASLASASSIAIAWSDVANADGYRVERSLNGTSGWTQVGTTAAGVTRFINPGLSVNVRYYYRIIAANAAGDSAPSVVVSLLVRNLLAYDDAYSIGHDRTLTRTAASGVLANDVDANGAPLTAILVDGVSHGTLTLNPNGSFTYIPAPGYSGTDSFTYRANNGSIDSAVAVVTIQVTQSAPVAVDDVYTVAHGRTLVVTTRGVLYNDTDADDDPLFATLITDVEHGTLTLNPDGTFTYLPNAGFTGTDSFIYQVSDGLDVGNQAKVTIRVTQTAPVAVDDVYRVGHDRTLTVTTGGVLFNDRDAENDPLTAILVTNVQHGTLVLNANGTFTYTPNAGYSGIDRFTYQASDGLLTSNTATVTITVSDTAPVARNDAYSVRHDRTLTVTSGGVLFNDTDAEDDPLTAILVTGVQHGTLT